MSSLDISQSILSDITIFSKYARYQPDLGRRETWDEIVDRWVGMHAKRFPNLRNEIIQHAKQTRGKKVLPSLRSLQFAGKPIELAPSRGYNCSFTPVNDWKVFSEVMFLLLGGTGVGYSVQFHDIDKLPEIRKPCRTRRYLIPDSREGWADAVKMLTKAYFTGSPIPNFDYGDIRPKGSPLKTAGGKAPGPEPLRDCLHNIRKILERCQVGDKLRPIEVHDIMCFIADAVLAGGIRRSAMIALFSWDDEEMRSAKWGNDWEELNPQRHRANNSAVALRHRIKEPEFRDFMGKVRAGNRGEPGVLFSNNRDMGTNPCQPGWATVLGPHGIRRLRDVRNGDVIWSGRQWTTITNKVMTGVRPVLAYRTRAGTFYGTKEHQVISSGARVAARDAELIDVATVPVASKLGSLNPQDVLDGLMLGDGSVHKASNNLMYLNIGQKDTCYHESEIASLIREERKGLGPYAWEVETTLEPHNLPVTYQRRMPERFLGAHTITVRGVLRGVFSANGSIAGNRVTLKASSFQMIEDVQQMLSILGIRSYYTVNQAKVVQFANGAYECKQSYDLNITIDRRVFAELIGFIHPYKTESLRVACETQVSSRPPKQSYDVVEIDTLGEEEVFDITVEAEEHTYWTGGLLVSNCAEIAIHGQQFCNLTEVNVSNLADQQDLNERVETAAFFGTLQAAYTDFHYLRDGWRKTTEREALLGIGMTGIASGRVLSLDLAEAAAIARMENARMAALLGINQAARLTCVKPSGTSSCVLGCSSGIHAWHDEFYFRRLRFNKVEAVYQYLSREHPELCEDDFFRPGIDGIVSIPQRAPEGAITRKESALDLLERVHRFDTEWVAGGHRSGDNMHNVSTTVSVKADEWKPVTDWMWKNRSIYGGITVLPHDGHKYVQAPFESISEHEYHRLSKRLKEIDLTQVKEYDDHTTRRDEVACGGGQCEL